MQDEFPHWNSLGAQEDGAHATSSEPSPQSSSLLHTKLREMQRPLAQVNSLGAQVMFPEKHQNIRKALKRKTVGNVWLRDRLLKQLGSNIRAGHSSLNSLIQASLNSSDMTDGF